MPRVKRGTTHVKKRKKLLAQAKGFLWGRKKLIRLAKTAVTKAGAHAYRDRKKKKRVNRGLQNIRISSAVQAHNLNYSRFIHLLKTKKSQLDRKVLAELAADNKPIFTKIIETISQ